MERLLTVLDIAGSLFFSLKMVHEKLYATLF